MKDTWKMFSTVRAKEFGSTTRSKKKIGVRAGNVKMVWLKTTTIKNKQTGDTCRTNTQTQVNSTTHSKN